MTEQTDDRYCVLVNGHAVEPGCWVEGSWGQYGPDHLADRATEVGWEPESDQDDPRWWRAEAERLTSENPPEPFCKHCRLSLTYVPGENGTSYWSGIEPGVIQQHEHTPTWPALTAWENHVESADAIETWLNEHTETEGYSWGWHDGEFYLWPIETWEEE